MTGFEAGFRAFAENAGVSLSALEGGDYINDVERSIAELATNLNKFSAYGTGIEQLKGNVAEYWHSGTFNIKATVEGSKAQTRVPASAGRNTLINPTLGSSDITSNFGMKASLKYTAHSAKDQAKTLNERYNEYLAQPRSGKSMTYDEYTVGISNNDPNAPLYLGQVRLVPSDQLEEAKVFLQRAIAKESTIRPEQALRYQETLDLITDKLDNGKGITSIPLEESEAKQIATEVKKAGFDPTKWGLTTEELITWKAIMSEAVNAGLSAAVISIVLEVAPELVKTISKALSDGEVDSNDFKCIGFAALKGSTLGFIRGGIASAITIACKAGKFGSSMKNVNPTVIGAVVALTMNTIQNATLMAFGKVSRHEFAYECLQNLFTTSSALAIGSLLQLLLPSIPVFAFMLGSFIGSIIGSILYNAAYGCAISFCVDTGCTFFGLVEQDYLLSEDTLREIGIDVFEYEKFQPQSFVPDYFEIDSFELEKFEPERISITFLRRGVIGVMCVGYL